MPTAEMISESVVTARNVDCGHLKVMNGPSLAHSICHHLFDPAECSVMDLVP